MSRTSNKTASKCENSLINNDLVERHWRNFNKEKNYWDPALSCTMTSYGLSEVLLHSGGSHMTSHSNHHGGLRVVFGQLYHNSHNFIIKNQTCLKLFSIASWYHNLPTKADAWHEFCCPLIFDQWELGATCCVLYSLTLYTVVYTYAFCVLYTSES